MALESMSGCCAAYNHTGFTSIHNQAQIPVNLHTINFLKIAKDDKKTFDYIGEIVKSSIELKDGILVTVSAADMNNLKLKTVWVAIDKMAQEAGRKDRNDLQVGDYVCFTHQAASFKVGPKDMPTRFRIRRKDTNAAGAYRLEYKDTWSNAWTDYGTYFANQIFFVAPGKAA